MGRAVSLRQQLWCQGPGGKPVEDSLCRAWGSAQGHLLLGTGQWQWLLESPHMPGMQATSPGCYVQPGPGNSIQCAWLLEWQSTSGLRRTELALNRSGRSSGLSPCPHLLTSKVSDEVLQHHLPVRLNIGAVHVSVEEDDSEGQDEDGVRVVELLHHLGVAHAVALAVVGDTVGLRSLLHPPQLQQGFRSG